MTLGPPQLLTAEPDQRVALRGTRLEVTLAGLAQKATLAQTFVNLEAVAIEAVYTFPVPAEAAVCGFEVVTADRVLTGQVEEAEEALELYDAAVSAGHAAFLLDQHRPDVFTVNVGNLKPGQAATVRITFVAPLRFHERRLRLAYPTTIAPRYVTASGQSDPIQAELDGAVLNPPHALSVPYGLTLALDVRLGRPPRAITSPTHALRCEAGVGDVVAVSLAAGSVAMDQDLVIEIDLAAEATPVAQAAAGPAGQGTFLAVTFLPELAAALAAPAAQEITFVLDCSGSMDGESIAQAKRALELCLRSMGSGDRFSICRFGSTFEFMSPTFLDYNETTLGQALAYLGQIRADLGGTELHGALAAVLQKAPTVGVLATVLRLVPPAVARAAAPKPAPAANPMHTIILLTDGQVSNEAAVIRLAETHKATCRIFSFGIGSACSHYLVQGLATATRGVAEFVAPNERIEEKVLRTFSRIGSPQVTDICLDWGTARAQQAPAETPPLFDGEPLTACACIEGDAPPALTLSCLLAGQRHEWRLPVERVADAGLLALTWARARLGDLEAALPTADPYAHGRHESPQQRRDAQQVVAISKCFGVLCSRTSYIALEHRSPAERNEGRPELRRVPLQLARGWHGVDAGPAPVLGLSSRAFCLAEPPAALYQEPGRARRSRVARLAASARPSENLGMVEEADALFHCSPRLSLDSAPPPPASKGAPDEATQLALELLSAQTAAGGFEWRPGFDAILAAVPAGGPRLRARLVAAFSLIDRPDRVQIENTLLVLWLLQHQCPAAAGIWRRAVTKAVAAAAKALELPPQELRATLAALG
jgi:Ca-activated chloride channel family protein